jgi:hypothetical protein
MLLEANPFRVYADDKSRVRKGWHAVGTVSLYVIGVIAAFGLIYTHTTSEHYDFACLPAGTMASALTAGQYHIGMCECTSSTDLQVSLDLTGAHSGCGVGPVDVAVPSCMPDTSTTWLQAGPGGAIFRGAVVKIGIPYCFGVEYSCMYGTCYPNGGYYGIQTIQYSGGTSSAEPRPLGTTSKKSFGSVIPAVKCCGFSERSKVSQALILIGSIGGTFGVISTFVLVLFKTSMIRST